MAPWTILRSWSFNGPAEPGADCEGGMAFAIRPVIGGEERTIAVQYACGGKRPSTFAFRTIAEAYLRDVDPPRYVTLDRQGKVIRTS